jgi:hypothetical protein
MLRSLSQISIGPCVRKNIESLIYLLPVTWMIAGAGFFLFVRVVPSGFRVAGAILSLAVSLALAQLLTLHTPALRGLPRLDVISLLAVAPWVVANTRQLLPFWNDAAHYVHSAHHLFAGSASLVQVMAIAGPQDVVQGDFHGPGYVLLHWPIALFTADSLSFMGSAMLAYSPVRILQTIAVLVAFQALRGAFGSVFALGITYTTFFFPWTNYLLSGTHREWIVLYAVTLLVLVVQHKESTSLALLFTVAVVFTQSHITTVLMLPALALFLAWRTPGPSESGANSSSRITALASGLAVGYSPLFMRVASGKVSGSASYDELMVVAPQALELFDASRMRSLVFGGDSLLMPPIPLSALLIVSAGVATSSWILRSMPRSHYRLTAAVFLTYFLTFCFAFVGVIDRTVNALNLSSDWFSLAKLLGANNRYWFALVMSSLLMLGLAIRDGAGRRAKETVLRLWSNIIVVWLRNSASAKVVIVFAGFSLFLPAVLVTVLHSGTGRLGHALLPGRSEHPISGYLQVLEEMQKHSLTVLLVVVVILVVARLTDSEASRRIAAVLRAWWQKFFSHRASAEAVVGLAAVLLAAPSAFAQDAMSYGRGTTASTAAVVDFWGDVLATATLDEECSLASSSSTTQAFINRREITHFNLNAGWAAVLWQSPNGTSHLYPENLPCILFPSGFIDYTPGDALWRSLYVQSVCDSLGICMHIDPRRVSLPTQEGTSVSDNCAHCTRVG